MNDNVGDSGSEDGASIPSPSFSPLLQEYKDSGSVGKASISGIRPLAKRLTQDLRGALSTSWSKHISSTLPGRFIAYVIDEYIRLLKI